MVSSKQVNVFDVDVQKLRATVTDAEFRKLLSEMLNGEKEKTQWWAQLVEVWFKFYKEKKGSDPNFTNGEQPALKRLMVKIKKKCLEANLDWCETTATSSLDIFLHSIKDKWILNNLQLKIVDSKFDPIYAAAKGNTPTSKAAELNQAIARVLGKQ